MTKLISIVIPAYRAEKFIVKTLSYLKRTLDRARLNYEIICVVDGKIDKTYQKALRFSLPFPRKIKVLGYTENLGKGHAVRCGMSKSKGKIIGFFDADLDINPDAIILSSVYFDRFNSDIVIGSKRHPESIVNYPWSRRILSSVYQILVRILFGLNVRDTQTGVKFFKRKVLERILPRLLVKAWAFDVEMLVVANYLGFKKIYEIPVELKTEFGGISVLTSRGFIRAIVRILWDTLAIFYRLHILRYYA